MEQIQIAIKKDGKLIDLQTAKLENVEGGEAVYFDNSVESLEILRHSTAHLMAQAIQELFPETKFFVGPVVDGGFYYDMRIEGDFSDKNLKQIEKKMQQLAKKKTPIEKYQITKAEAIEKFKDDDLKLAVLEKIPDEIVSIYKQGEWEDLCRGPHLPHQGLIKAFKLQRVAGAYLGGDSNKEMLTRVYGTAFADKQALADYLNMLKEAQKRDHRKIGNEMDLWFFDEKVGPGLPIWLPKGATLRANLEKLLFKAHITRGYEPVKGPEILKSDMWKISGHYQNYKENMYFTTIEDDNAEYGIKPMNCLSHVRMFDYHIRSYKDLPLKLFEFGTVHRHEKSGVLHGLLRVREFTQDDAHIFCTPSQIEQQVIEVLSFVDKIMHTFGFDYDMEISTKPDKAIGEDEIWNIATDSLKKALDNLGKNYGIDEGGGAFYGPKIDIKITDAIGRKWQCGTIQVDFNLPERFDINYIDENNTKQRPVMLHRAILGSFERFIAILTEHFAGEFPTFIAPVKAILVPISETHFEYCKILQQELLFDDIKVEVYNSNDSLNKRIRNAEKQRVPYVIIVGDEEVQNNKVAIRDRRKKEKYDLSKDEFINKIKEENEVRL